MKQMNCIENIKVDTSDCLKPCSGLIVTSFTKTQENRNMDNWLTVLDDYQVYKKVTVVPFGETGKYYIKIYHPVNRLRSFLSLGHSVTRSLGHSVTIFNIVTD